MNEVFENFLKEMQEKLNDPEYIKQERKLTELKERITKKHRKKVKSYYSNKSEFNDFVLLNISRHGDDWDINCYSRGFQPYSKKILKIIFNIALEKGKTVDKSLDNFTKDFPSTIKKYKGLYFVLVYGQGTISSIYNKNKECIYSAG